MISQESANTRARTCCNIMMKIIHGLMLHYKSDLLPDYFNILQIEIPNNRISNELKLREKHQGSFGHVKRHKS